MKRSHTGVIVGVDRDWTAADVKRVSDALRRTFPNVTFAVVTGAQSVAFEWDVEVFAPAIHDEIEPPPPPPPNSGTRVGRRGRS